MNICCYMQAASHYKGSVMFTSKFCLDYEYISTLSARHVTYSHGVYVNEMQ